MRVLLSFWQGLVNIFSSSRYRVEGHSMLPSLRHGESVWVVRTRLGHGNRLLRGDMVVFERPGGGGGGVYIKRIVGLPGEDLRTAGGRVYLDGKMLEEDYLQGDVDSQLNGPAVRPVVVEQDGRAGGENREWFNGPDEYFLLGDNRADSNDSRVFGPVPGHLIRGRAWFRSWPPLRWRLIGPVRRD